MKWRERKQKETSTDEANETRLKTELPDGYLENGWIRRKYKTSGWKSALMVVNTAGIRQKRRFIIRILPFLNAFVIV